MRTSLLLLLTGSLLSAQNTELFTNSWYISKIVVNGQTITTPAMDFPLNATNFRTTGTSAIDYTSKYFNSCQTEIVFVPNTNSFTKSGSGCTLWGYAGSNMAAVEDYDQKHSDFFIYPAAGSIFNYEIVPGESGNTLIVTNPANGNQLYYNASYLTTQETRPVKSILKIYPNPVKEELHIENITKNLPVKIFDMQGKQIYESVSSEGKLNIKTEGLPKGKYILAVGDDQSSSFIKE